MIAMFNGQPIFGPPAENVYSTEETRIGTWIDGKAVYRKCFEGTIDALNKDLTITSIPGLETLTNYYATTVRSNGTIFMPIPASDRQNWSALFYIYQQNLVVYSSCQDHINAKVIGWVEYTKTTD